MKVTDKPAPAPTAAPGLDPGLEFVGPNRKGVAFFSAYFVRLPDGRVLSIDDADVPESYQEYGTNDAAVTQRAADVSFGVSFGELGEGELPPPTLEELAAALVRRAERRKRTGTK